MDPWTAPSLTSANPWWPVLVGCSAWLALALAPTRGRRLWIAPCLAALLYLAALATSMLGHGARMGSGTEALRVIAGVLLAYLAASRLAPTAGVRRALRTIWVKSLWLLFGLFLTLPLDGSTTSLLLQRGRHGEWQAVILLLSHAPAALWISLKQWGRTPLERGFAWESLRKSALSQLVSAFAEEALFRGILFAALLPLGSMPALLVQAALFSVLHLRHGDPSGPRGAALTFGTGLLLGIGALYFRSLVPLIALHGLFLPVLPVALREVRERRRRERSPDLPLIRCRQDGRVYLCGGPGSGVKIALSQVANAIAREMAKGTRDDTILVHLDPGFGRADVKQALSELRAVEAQGGRVIAPMDAEFTRNFGCQTGAQAVRTPCSSLTPGLER